MNSKEKILSLLSERPGEYVSGEEIAGYLSLSRNSVWKAVRALKAEGYEIASVTNRGYCLSPENDILSAQGIKGFLEDDPGKSCSRQPYRKMCVRASEDGGGFSVQLKGPDKGRCAAGMARVPCLLHVYSSVESTNESAKEMALKGAAHGTVVAAETQAMGRGRHLKRFYSPVGGIYASFILRPPVFPYSQPEVVTAYAALCVLKTVFEISGRQAVIRPVNDIYLSGKKIAGILTESVLDFESGETQWIVVGTGINLILDENLLPEDLRNRAGAVFGCDEPRPSRNEVLGRLIRHMLCDYAGVSGDEIMREYGEETKYSVLKGH